MPALIIDTFNVLHTTGVLPPELAGLDVTGLAGLILRSRHASDRVTFACDGLPASDLPAAGALVIDGHPDAVMDVQFSGRQATADDLIMRMIDVSTAPRRLTVVSSDHAIGRHARKRRCIVLTSEEFLQQLADDAHLPRPANAPPRRPPMMSAEQVEGWRRVFDVDEQALIDSLKQPIAEDQQSEIEAPAPPSPPNAEAAPTPPALLPADLISEAERLWRGASPSARVPDRKNSPSPDRGHPVANPPPPATISDEFDMGAILPPDGRTLPLRKRTERHRPDGA